MNTYGTFCAGLLVLVLCGTAWAQSGPVPCFPDQMSAAVTWGIVGNGSTFISRRVIVDTLSQRASYEKIVDWGSKSMQLPAREVLTFDRDLLVDVVNLPTLKMCFRGKISDSVNLKSMVFYPATLAKSLEYQGPISVDGTELWRWKSTSELCVTADVDGTQYCGIIEYFEASERAGDCTVRSALMQFIPSAAADDASLLGSDSDRFFIAIENRTAIEITANNTATYFPHPSLWTCSRLLNCTCDKSPVVTEILGAEICDAPMIPTWIGAVSIGLFFSRKMFRLGPSVIGSRSYAITYFLYAIMMSIGFLVHSVYRVECHAQAPTSTYGYLALIDGWLSSGIALTFAFNMLVDLRLISERGWTLYVAEALTFAVVLVGYFMYDNFVVMYKLLILVVCGIYVVVEFVLLIRAFSKRMAADRHDCDDDADVDSEECAVSDTQAHWLIRSSLWLALAGFIFAGVFGLTGILTMLSEFTCHMCIRYGGWVYETVWYALSDLSMMSLAVFIYYSRSYISASTLSIYSRPVEKLSASSTFKSTAGDQLNCKNVQF